MEKTLKELLDDANLTVAEAARQSRTNYGTWRAWANWPDGKYSREPWELSKAWLEQVIEINDLKKEIARLNRELTRRKRSLR